MRNRNVMVVAAALALTSCATSYDRTALSRHANGGVAVSLDDLDLATPEGAKKLRTRVFAAAQKVCARASGSVVTVQSAERKCRSEVMDHYDLRFARMPVIETPIIIKTKPAMEFKE